jgi:hypothetical protein
VQVLDGRTETPIPTLLGTRATQGQGLVLSAPGFLTLRTTYRGMPVLLWPNDAALPLGATRALVYQGNDPQVLVRWSGDTRLNLAPEGALRSEAWVMPRIEAAAAVVSRIHPAIDVTLDGAGMTVPVRLDPDDGGFTTHPNAAALAYVRYGDSGRVTEARIVVRSLDREGFWHGEGNFQTAMVHEIIHATGLVGHLPSGTGGTMSPTAESYRFPEPTPAEALIMKLHYARMVGTILAGDTESEEGRLGTSDVERSEWHLVCAQ